MAASFSDLTFTHSTGLLNNASDFGMSQLNGQLRKLIGQGDGPIRFYYKNDQRAFWRVLVDSALQRVASELISQGKQAVADLLKKKKKQELFDSTNQKQILIEKGELQNSEKESVYGKMDVVSDDGNSHTILCRDRYGFYCADGLMMKCSSAKSIEYSTYEEETTSKNKVDSQSSSFKAPYLVWYDPTAIISINSSKNLIITPVSGRDYSRKELVSNGDIQFSVSGHMLSKMADVYPDDDVKKFRQMMQYKGIIEVNNIVLDQFGISKIVIKDFSLSPTEGGKSRQDYTFNAIGIQPDSEIAVEEDTLFIESYIQEAGNEKENKWTEFLKNKAKGAAYQMTDIFDQVGSSAIGGIIG